MEKEKNNFNNKELTKTFEHKSMIIENRKNKLVNQYNEILKSYKVIFILNNISFFSITTYTNMN